ncbi:MAG TPA: hypothetical protein ENJ24_00065 [Gammaproteobacteria bacterium]|nr:hypothetical protein [Gammaproteobacteria bacterium]
MNSNQPGMFSNSILVVAHPDDEILWFSSIMKQMDEILFCFCDYPSLPALGNARKKVLAEYPLDNISNLDIEESGSFSGADWNTPTESPSGMAITQGRRIKLRYRKNFNILEKLLAEKLRDYDNVFTHNPWGEYGHEDHVQVYRAIKKVQQQHAFQIWFSNYASNRSAKLMFNYISGFDSRYISLPTNPAMAQKIATLYKRHGCWTWYGDYHWFEQECFTQDVLPTEDIKNYGHLFPINMLKTDFPTQPWKKQSKLSLANKKIQHKLGRKLFSKKLEKKDC